MLRMSRPADLQEITKSRSRMYIPMPSINDSFLTRKFILLLKRTNYRKENDK